MSFTTTASLSQEVQAALSAELLIQPDDVYLFFDFGPIQRADADAQVPGTNIINFNRPVLPTGTYTETSRRLTEGTPIDAGIIPITMTQVSLTTREYAGPHDGTAVRPFGVTEFFKNRAKHNAIALIGEFLRRDRYRWQDVVTANLLLAATTVVTPSGDSEATVGAGQKASVAWLRAWNKSMTDAKIPTYPSGNWRLMLNTTDEQNLKSDPEYREAMRYFAKDNPLFKGRLQMSIEGFDIMKTTMFSTSAVGAGSAVTGYQSCAWGPYGIGWGTPLPPSVRAKVDTDYGRQEAVLWKTEEAIGLLYTDLIQRGVTT